MFLGVILVCGISGLNPLIEQGCAPVTSKKVFATRDECVNSLQNGVEFVANSGQKGVFISDMKCVKLSSSA